ncbi:inorganic phosphate transporter 1 isoform X2 [Bombyx mori]|uniref:Major facilitator superfamily (MFS) profile domain-containing protein n=1 Tax=Bombyx mori TaxID=7091 RepID=A0A8R2QYT4_BOMMO|nr:inorganic phosphate transporter 1 isoform X2 [Bombyx mori]
MPGEKAVYKGVPADDKYEGSSPKIPAPKGFGTRHTQALVLFICLTVAYTMRAQLSVSMVAITGHAVTESELCSNVSTSENTSCVTEEISAWSVYRTYNWNKSTQEMILFAFFVGYTTMMIPMGIIAQKFGGKFPISVALFVNGVVSIISPWIPLFSGWMGLATCRLIQGMTQAALYPSMHTMLGKWAPLSERGRLSTYVYTGSQFGTILIFEISGLFAGTPVLGWPAIFWLCGILSFASFGLLIWFVAPSPREHPTISAEELSYITQDGNVDAFPKKRRTPWTHILTSTAVWGLVVSHAGSSAGYLLVLTQMPTYMNEILNVNIETNGIYSSLPYLSMFTMAIFFGYISDYLLNKKIMTVANIRRTANTIGMVLSGFFLIGFCYVDKAWLAVLLLMISFGMHSAVHTGFHKNPSRWQIVFLITVSFQFITNAVFVIFVKGSVQPWNFHDEERIGTGVEELKSLNDHKNSIKEKEKLGNS